MRPAPFPATQAFALPTPPPNPFEGGFRLTQAGMSRALAEGTTVLVGRDPEAAIILADPRVSGRHAELSVRQGRVVVRDLGSTAGTFVNGQRIEGTVEIAAGAEVRFGPTAFRLEAVPVLASG